MLTPNSKHQTQIGFAHWTFSQTPISMLWYCESHWHLQPLLHCMTTVSMEFRHPWCPLTAKPCPPSFFLGIQCFCLGIQGLAFRSFVQCNESVKLELLSCCSTTFGPFLRLASLVLFFGCGRGLLGHDFTPLAFDQICLLQTRLRLLFHPTKDRCTCTFTFGDLAHLHHFHCLHGFHGGCPM